MTEPGAQGGQPLQVGDLNAIAQTLATAAQGFQDVSADAPTLPDAGRSTDSVAGAFAALADAMVQATLSAANAADRVQGALGDYDATEQDNAAHIGRTGALVGPHPGEIR